MLLFLLIFKRIIVTGHMRWTPDGTVLGLSWVNGGFSLWSVFGSLLSSSLKWDYSDHSLSRPICIKHMVYAQTLIILIYHPSLYLNL